MKVANIIIVFYIENFYAAATYSAKIKNFIDFAIDYCQFGVNLYNLVINYADLSSFCNSDKNSIFLNFLGERFRDQYIGYNL